MLVLSLRLDFDAAADIIRSAFSASSKSATDGGLSETHTYLKESCGSFATIEQEVLGPLLANKAIIDRITQMISAHYGAHG